VHAGHTHEDIDACFGTLSKCINTFHKHIPTLDLYKEIIEKEFNHGNLKCKIIDVMLIPDYQSILADCVDPKLNHLHKEMDTQHQWQFEAVEPCAYFPLGCRTTYRAYCSDRVVEFVKKCKDLCQSKIGRILGLEPVSVRCKWYPSAECDPQRQGIEGFWILQNVPDFKLYESLPNYVIHDKSHSKLTATKNEILRVYTNANADDKAVRETWMKWFDIYLPETNNPEEYPDQLTRKGVMYNTPLRNIIFSSTTRLNRDLNPYDVLDRLNDESIVWPEVVAYAMPSVSTSFNENPPPSRVYYQHDDAWVDSKASFVATTQNYYDTVLPLCTNDSVKHMLRNTLTFCCSFPSTSGMPIIYYILL
jgi:hypothetical protein